MSQNRNNSQCHIAFVMLFFLIFWDAKTLQVNTLEGTISGKLIRGEY